MAQGKKSFTAYCDWLETFEALEDDQAGKLVKHLFRYVNDQDPEPPDPMTKAVFAQIKATLKRDLAKWEAKREQNRANAQKRWDATASDRMRTDANDAVSVSDSVTVSDNDSDKVINLNKTLLSKIDISDVEEDQLDYFRSALLWQKLFIKNLQEKNAPTRNQEKATYKNYVTPIRLMFTKDGVTKEQMRQVYDYLNSDRCVSPDFSWKDNILSTKKLREKFQQLVLKSKNIDGSDKKDSRRNRRRN